MRSDKLKNRWLIALSAIGIHISIGSIYAYSIITNPVKEVFSADGSDIKWAFKLAILFLGLTTTFLGKWVERSGPRKSGIAAALLYGSGLAGSGVAVYLGSLPLFYISYGIMGGIGLGLGYMAPVSTLVKWFPDRKGLATGMAIMGFGFSALIFGPLMQALFDTVGIAKAFYTLGTLFLLLISGSSLYLETPPKDYSPAETQNKTEEGKSSKAAIPDTDPRSAMRTNKFWYLWVMMFINISCGIALISAASPLMQEVLEYTPLQAAATVGIIGVFNGLGRIFWSGLSDYSGRENTFILFFLFQAAAFYFLPRTSSEWVFLPLLFTVISMYGGGFAILPAFAGDLFGTKHLGVINGRVLSSWALAGVAGPTLYDGIKTLTGSLNTTLTVFSVLFILALGVSFLMRSTLQHSNKSSQGSVPRKLLSV